MDRRQRNIVGVLMALGGHAVETAKIAMALRAAQESKVTVTPAEVELLTKAGEQHEAALAFMLTKTAEHYSIQEMIDASKAYRVFTTIEDETDPENTPPAKPATGFEV